MPPPMHYSKGKREAGVHGKSTNKADKRQSNGSYDGRATYAGRSKSNNWVADDDVMLYN